MRTRPSSVWSEPRLKLEMHRATISSCGGRVDGSVVMRGGSFGGEGVLDGLFEVWMRVFSMVFGVGFVFWSIFFRRIGPSM